MSHKIKTQTKNGFTLIELMLAMTFISILLLTIAMTIVQIATIYNRGIIAKEVNISSRQISNELGLAMNASTSFSVLPADHHYIDNAWGGRLCVGKYSYIWNYGSALYPSTLSANRNMYDPAQPVNTAANIVKIGSATRYEISLVKAPDASGVYCTPNASGVYPNINPTGAVELLRTGDHALVLHYLNVSTSAGATDALSAQQLYKITFVLGSSDMSAITGTQAATLCIAPGLPGADPNYCQIQKFTIVLRVVSGVN